MKRRILIAVVCMISANLFSQTYKLETVFTEKVSETYLSHWKVLDSTNINQVDTFSLWGYQLYFDNWANGAYEVEYYKGNAKETYLFLNHIIGFTEKYKDEDEVVTSISGVRVKTLKLFWYKTTLVYEKENKVSCKFNLNQWTEIRSKFVSYCDDQKINYK
jgi:hypothetical protein